jgi:hypothetical protein
MARRTAPVLIPCFLLPLLVACGVDFTSPESGSEFFKSISIDGELRAGASLTVIANYEQYYPADVDVTCELRRDKSLLKTLGASTVPALAGGTPDSTPVPGHVAFDFTVDAPGSYRVECLTPKDEDNYISEEISVAP